MNVGTVVAVDGRPVSAGSRMSLLPTQTVANVGCASSARSTIVLPPRISSDRGLAFGPTWAVGSAVAIPGTATLLRTAVTELGLRSAQVLLVDAGAPLSVTRVCARKLLTGGGQPGMASD